MNKFEDLLGDIDSNDFEKVKKFLSSLKAQKAQPSTVPSSFIGTIDEELSLFEVFGAAKGSKLAPKKKGKNAEGAKLECFLASGREEKKMDESFEKNSEKYITDNKMSSESPGSKVKGALRTKKLEVNQRVSKRTPSKASQIVNTSGGQSLSSFGFFESAVKSSEEDRKKLFSSFIQDKRIVPVSIRFWDDAPLPSKIKLPSQEDAPLRVGDSCSTNPVDPFLALREEDSSLLHPPLPLYNEIDFKTHSQRHLTKLTFAELIESSNFCHHKDLLQPSLPNEVVVKSENVLTQSFPLTLLGRCGCPFHESHIPSCYENFDNETLYCGFYSIGYDPFLARPPFFGSYNHFSNENISEVELLRLARFPVGEEPPRFSTLDYDYDSGDDWDLLEGDEEIGSSVDDEEDEEMSLSSSDLDFINDNQEDNDSDDELQRNMIDARERRKKRLRGKDKLIPSFSGPFVGLLPHEHPLQQYDRLECFAPPLLLSTSSDSISETLCESEKRKTTVQSEEDYFETILRGEVELFGGVGNSYSTCREVALDDELETAMKQKLQEAALRNRREMSSDELEALHLAISLHNRASSKVLLDILRSKQLCVGVAQVEFMRTLKRFYEKKHGMLVRREVPWVATDERLFTSKSSVPEETATKLLATTSEEVLNDASKADDIEQNQVGKTAYFCDSFPNSSRLISFYETSDNAFSTPMQLKSECPHTKKEKDKVSLKRSRSPDTVALAEEKTTFDLMTTASVGPS